MTTTVKQFIILEIDYYFKEKLLFNEEIHYYVFFNIFYILIN